MTNLPRIRIELYFYLHIIAAAEAGFCYGGFMNAEVWDAAVVANIRTKSYSVDGAAYAKARSAAKTQANICRHDDGMPTVRLSKKYSAKVFGSLIGACHNFSL
jgi:hypothetical protein